MGRRDPIHFKKYMSSHADKRAPQGQVTGPMRYGATRTVLITTELAQPFLKPSIQSIVGFYSHMGRCDKVRMNR